MLVFKTDFSYNRQFQIRLTVEQWWRRAQVLSVLLALPLSWHLQVCGAVDLIEGIIHGALGGSTARHAASPP